MALVESFSGIRGIYGKELTDDIALRYAYVFGNVLRERKKNIKVVVGRDTRASGENLRMAIIEGLDCDVIDVCMLPTPAIENAVREYNADGGVIITGSHNEPEYNGLKFLDKDGAVLRPADIGKVISGFHKIKEMSEREFLNSAYKKKGLKIKNIEKKERDAFARYKRFALGFFNKKEKDMINKSGLKIVVDPNGGAGIAAKEILDEIGVRAVYVNMDKGKFRRKIEPNEQSIKCLVNEIKKSKSEFAAGFDCDADRVEIMTGDGRLVSGNHILAIITEEILSCLKHPEKETVVVNDATSYVVREIVMNYNARWQEVEVGEINVVDAMMDFNSPVGGEGSNGGVIIPPSRCRDGILTLLYIIKIMAGKKKKLRELVEEIPEYCYIKKKVKKNGFPRGKLKKKYLAEGFTIEETGDETGGLKAIKEGSWVWFRQSKTEDNVVRIIADSKDDKAARKLIRDALKAL